LVCNHLNNVDSGILLSLIPRRSVWLVKSESFRNPLIGMLLRWGGMIPIRRHEADLAGMRKAKKALKDSLILGIFPEGTRSQSKSLVVGEPGTAIFALQGNVNIIPCSIWGTEDIRLPRAFFSRTRGINVRIGKPFKLSPLFRRMQRQDIETGTETIMRVIAALLPENYRGVYAQKPSGESEKREVVV